MKQDRPGKVFGSLRLYKYLTPDLCVYTTLQQYLSVTATRRGSTKLLVLYIRPFNAVTFSTHSMRSAATSKAAATVPIDAILKTAGWSRECTFRKYYNKPVVLTNQFSEGVLGGV